MESAAERKRLAHNDRARLAWNIVALPGSRKTLNDLLIRPQKQSQTPEQRLAVAAAWASALSTTKR